MTYKSDYMNMWTKLNFVIYLLWFTTLYDVQGDWSELVTWVELCNLFSVSVIYHFLRYKYWTAGQLFRQNTVFLTYDAKIKYSESN
jgi:hypothetical protein